jgi:hypothetical protein
MTTNKIIIRNFDSFIWEDDASDNISLRLETKNMLS